MKTNFFFALLLFAIGAFAQQTSSGTTYYPINSHATGGAGTGGYYNTHVGYKAGNDNHVNSSYGNTFIGYLAGLNNEGGENTGVGQNALKANTTGSSNVAVGNGSMLNNTSGYFNIALGRYSLSANTTGFNNISIGQGALRVNDVGDRNIAIGGSSLWYNTSGKRNIAIGVSAGYNNQTGEANIFLGEVAGGALTSGTWNSFFGPYAGNNLTTGNYNLFVGPNSGRNLISGNNNAFFGNVQLAATASTATVAGNDTSNSIILANGNGNQGLFIHSNGNTGIGLGNNVIPQNKLEVKHGVTGNSGLRLTSMPNTVASIANPTNKVLSVNANGDVILVNDTVGTGSGTSTSVVAGTNINVIGDPVSGYTVSSPYQTLSLSGNDLTLSNGGTVTLPMSVDTDEQTLSIDNNQLTISNGNTITLPSFTDTDAQTVSISGNTLTISNGNSVQLPIDNLNIYNSNGTIDTSSDVAQGVRVVTMGNNNLFFNSSPSTTTDNTRGKIYIGDSAVFGNNQTDSLNNYSLFVENGILTERVKVALRSSANWADYVFANDYKLMTLKEVEAFVKENKHLPGVPSAENLAKEGLELGEMQAKQMEKIEELTLHLIEQNKQIERQNKEIEELKAQMKMLINKMN